MYRPKAVRGLLKKNCVGPARGLGHSLDEPEILPGYLPEVLQGARPAPKLVVGVVLGEHDPTAVAAASAVVVEAAQQVVVGAGGGGGGEAARVAVANALQLRWGERCLISLFLLGRLDVYSRYLTNVAGRPQAEATTLPGQVAVLATLVQGIYR